jgi:hypothetical protein
MKFSKIPAGFGQLAIGGCYDEGAENDNLGYGKRPADLIPQLRLASIDCQPKVPGRSFQAAVGFGLLEAGVVDGGEDTCVGFDQELQGSLATPLLLIFIIIGFIADILICPFVYRLHDVNDDVRVLVTEEANKCGHRTRLHKFRVGQNRDLR